MLPIQTFLAQEIVEDLEAALKQSRKVVVDPGAELPPGRGQT
jgi:hypothetical protein